LTKFVARRIPQHTGRSGWCAILPARPRGPLLEAKIDADIVIVGAGFAGLSAARRCVELDPRARVVVLEAGAISESTAGRNSGFMIDLPHDLNSKNYADDSADSAMGQVWLNRQAISFAGRIASELGLDKSVFDACGKVNGAATSAGDRANRQYAEHLKSISEEAEFLDTNAMRSLTGSEHYISGVFTPGTVLIQPASYIRALADSLRDDIQLYENSPVLTMERVNNSWQLATPKGGVRASKVILANNGQVESFGFFKHRLMHVFLYASMTADIAHANLPGDRDWGITPSNPMGTSVRRFSDGDSQRLLLRSYASYNSDMVTSEKSVERARQAHRKKLAQRYPDLAGVELENSWAGHLCLSANGSPAFGEVAEDMWSACCQNGLGTTKGTAAGVAAAERAFGAVSDLANYLEIQPENQKIVPEPFAGIGANAYLKFNDWRAGVE
jgi:glycine/D-amino acid oxidase-like deaminating enzyme